MIIVTSLFLLSLMCSYMPCDRKFEAPQIQEAAESEVRETIRFPRSGPPKLNQVQDGTNPSSGQQEGGSNFPVVGTTSGAVEGYFMKIINNRVILAFEGIPYAQPPVGHLRWRNPMPKLPWSGIRQAKEPGANCLQFHVRKLIHITGKEDCLNLNIYTIGLPSTFKGKSYNPLYPVIIYLHGGGYFFGSGSEYGPSYLLQDDVILVTVNFRQGVFGFLSTQDDESPGNFGLKDQALALRWISENIGAFGGDPKKITLMGQSTGAAAAHLHTMSPLSKHLFQGVVSFSGTALNHWAVNSESRSLRLTRKLAENVGCPTTAGSRALMDCLRATNPYFLLHEQQRLYDFMTFPPILFAPVVERNGPEAFLPDTPENLYAAQKVARVPWICTQTTEEGESFALAFKHVGRIPFYQRSFDKFAPIILDYWYIANNASEITEKIRRAYFGNDGPKPTDGSIRAVSDLVSDRYFRVGIHRAITLHSELAPTYASLFGFRSQIAYPSLWGNDPKRSGVGHASDTGFYFNSSSNFAPLAMGTPGYDLSRMLINFIYHFAAKREPYLTYNNGNVIKMWKPATFQGSDLRFLLIDNENVIMIPEPRQYAIKFWESLGLRDTPATNGGGGEDMVSAQSISHASQLINPESLQVLAPPMPFEPSINYYQTS